MENPTIVFPAAGEVELRDRERPDPDADEVLIETTTSLVSTGTELTVLSGDYPADSDWDAYGEYPFVAGYANVGTVVETGAATDLDVGTRVATWSPHAAYVTAAAEDCVRVPAGVSDEAAVPFAIAQVVMNGLRRGRVDWGETVVVYGLGILGQLTVRLCRIAGAVTVVGVDLADERLAYVPDSAGVVAVNPDEADPATVVADATGGDLADVVFEVTGNPDAIPGEFEPLREQGRLVVLSSPRGETTLDFHDLVNGPSTEIVGAHLLSHPDSATPDDPWTRRRNAELYFSYLQQDRLSVTDLFSHVVDAGDAPALYRDLLADRSDAMGVRIEW